MAVTGQQEVCFLCEKPMSDAEKRSLDEPAIQSLLEASVRRQDGRRAQLESRKYLSLHRACQEAYLKEPAAEGPQHQQMPGAGRAQSLRAAKSAAVERIKSDPALTVRARTLCLELYNFDFTTLCFVCGLPANETGLQRKSVKHVNSDTVRTDILQVIENQPSNNKYVQDIYQRLKPVDDLTKVCGRYHSDCLARLYRYQNFVPKRPPRQGSDQSPKPRTEERDEAKKENENDAVIEIKKSKLV